jgi:hypothetical protein
MIEVYENKFKRNYLLIVYKDAVNEYDALALRDFLIENYKSREGITLFSYIHDSATLNDKKFLRIVAEIDTEMKSSYQEIVTFNLSSIHHVVYKCYLFFTSDSVKRKVLRNKKEVESQFNLNLENDFKKVFLYEPHSL